jgi:phage protein D
MPQTAYQLAFDDEAVDEEFYGDVVSLTVEEQTTAASTLALRLATRLQDDGSWSYLEDDRLTPLTKVSLRLGFTGGEGLAGALGGLLGGNDGLEPVFDGYITAVSVSLGGAPGDSAISVSAVDASFLLSLEEKVATWPNLSDSDIVQQIVAGYGLEVRAEPTATVHQENDTTIVQRGADLQFVHMLAQRNGYEFYFETDKASQATVAFFRPPQLDGTPQPDLAIQFGEESNLSRFAARLSAQRPLTVKTAQVDVPANSVNAGQAGETQLALLGAADLSALVGDPLGSLVTPAEASAQMLVLGAPTSDATELQTLAQAVRDEAGWFIAASGEINSNAYQTVLRPRRLVLVKGAGRPYSGKYYVTRVIHELHGDGRYGQRFEARRNARDLDGSEQFGGDGLGLPLPGGMP